MAARSRAVGPPPANPRAAIQDWLNLVEPDGAFLTPTELLAVFPHGFERMDTDVRTELRARVADLGDDPDGRTDLRRWLLGTALDWDVELADGQRTPGAATARIAEHSVHLRPDAVLLDVDDPNRVRLGVFTWPIGTPLDRRPDAATTGDTWPATPIQRAESWCREAGIPLALVTDNDQWALVWAPRGAPAASCRWRISDLADERILRAGLVSLLGARRFFAVAEDQTLEKLFERAADAEVEITKGLGLSVRRSVELLVAAISRDDVASEGRVLAGVAPTEVYEASVSVLMRLVFLLFAEERRLLPAEDPLWAESYSVLTLRDDLRTAATRDGEDALERRATAWHRLLATFRAVHGGANHDRFSLPAYGGSLFDPARYPFLEGRPAPDHVVAGDVDLGPADDAMTGPGRPVAIDDRTILAILDSLLNIKVRSGRSTVTQRVSYKALDVEQIGHCYEGLLDHGCARVDELSLGLIGTDGDEPEIAITDLEAQLADGTDALCDWLADKTRCNRKATVLAKELARQPEGIDLARLRVACSHDDATVERVLPLWGLIRPDLRGLPIVILPGTQYVTQTSTRRNMGAQYTTKALAEEVVRYALEPLVYDPGPQNEPDLEKWRLRTPHDILDLRVCDPAVGSGAILTAAGRYLADRLIESVGEHGPGDGRFADRLTDLASAPPDEQAVIARREVVDHCLYGVDKNPVAAEMAKLSLWLTTMARERPFTFLDHAIQLCDSLLGITDLEQLRWLHLDPAERKGQAGFETLVLDLRLKEAAELARRLQELSVVTVRDASEKQRLHDELKAKLGELSVVADTVVGAALSIAGQRGVPMSQRLDSQLDRIRTALDDDRAEIEREAALVVLRSQSTEWLRTDLPDEAPMPWDRQCLHWPLAFPEVFLDDRRSGFDTIIGNPPFLGGTKIAGAMGSAYRDFVALRFAGRPTNRADFVCFFLLLSARIGNRFGLLTTTSIAEGEAREIALDRLLSEQWIIHRCVKSVTWPGESQLEIAKIWLTSRLWTTRRWANGLVTPSISSFLEPGSAGRSGPAALARLSGRSTTGCKIDCGGFYLSAAEAAEVIRADPISAAVVRPLFGGEDLYSAPLLEAKRWVVDFGSLPEAEARRYAEPWAIVEARVKPDVLSKSRAYASWHKRWWQFWNVRPIARRFLAAHQRVLAMAEVSFTMQPLFVETSAVYSHKVILFDSDDEAMLGLLASSFHYWWVVAFGPKMRTAPSYSVTQCFETFAQPEPQAGNRWDAIASAGRALNDFRTDLMVRLDLGLTKAYNRVHNPDEQDSEIVRLRDLHVELDHAVRDAYGWSDLTLDHHHWETPQGMRFTVSPGAKDELLDRLLELNHERYAAEVAAGLHDKKKPKEAAAKRGSRRADPEQKSLL
jgi:hypothetical protein